MGQWLNKFLLILFFACLFSENIVSQNETVVEYDDYKDKDQFKKFYRRRKVIGAWQINQLKTGALVVRLKTNKKLIESLKTQGNIKLASEKALETFIINKNTMMAYRNNYDFSKVYFINSNSSDSLLQGVRSGIFLDTNLQVDPKIVMNESFYLIAERDFAYNSSIGFVPLDSANKIFEKGNPGVEMSIIIKNKFGHQLKNPFPYAFSDYLFGSGNNEYLGHENIKYGYDWFLINSLKQEIEIRKSYPEYNYWIKLEIDKPFVVSKLGYPVMQLNQSLKAYFQSAPPPDLDRINPETKKLLY